MIWGLQTRAIWSENSGSNTGCRRCNIGANAFRAEKENAEDTVKYNNILQIIQLNRVDELNNMRFLGGCEKSEKAYRHSSLDLKFRFFGALKSDKKEETL